MINEQFILEAGLIHESFPKLKQLTSTDGKVIVAGEIDIVDRDGKFWESYQIEIHPTALFPMRYPWVFEAGGKIPKIGDWHIWEDTLNCCMGIEPEEIIKCLNGISLLDFINQEVLPYFFNQTFRRQEGYYPNGEYSHSAKGIFEYYSHLLKTDGDAAKTVKAMMFVLHMDRPGRREDCFCGSKEKYRRCHRTAVDKIKLLGEETVTDHAVWLTKVYNVQL